MGIEIVITVTPPNVSVKSANPGRLFNWIKIYQKYLPVKDLKQAHNREVMAPATGSQGDWKTNSIIWHEDISQYRVQPTKP